MSAYAPCPDITKVVTPDLKCPSTSGGKSPRYLNSVQYTNYAASGRIVYVSFAGQTAGKHRTGGSALVQCFSQVGDLCPDVHSPETFVNAFRCTQRLISGNAV